MQKVWGFVYMSVFNETGLTEKGAKISATRNGCDLIGYRSPINNMFIETHRKVDGKWKASNLIYGV
jgi:hypothetical protein